MRAMTEQPAEEPFEDPWHEQLEETREDFGAPAVLAVVAFVLAVVSVLGLGLLNGSAYIAPFLSGEPMPTSRDMVAGPVVGAVLALIPVVLGWRAVSRALPDDPDWVTTLGRAAFLLGLVSVLLRLLIAVLQASADSPTGFTRF